VSDTLATANQQLKVTSPNLWSDVRPYLYKAVTKVYSGKTLTDTYTTNFGIRYFKFDEDKGFTLNGVPTKILGVCDHHDLGSLGAAVSVRATERQLEILKDMGCNAIRTSHNPPSNELLDLCDKMGFIVMDEAFDVWQRAKEKYDYSVFFNEWHKRDLEDQILRDRNHPSVIIWSIGNEIPEQGRASGGEIAKELAAIVHSLDVSRQYLAQPTTIPIPLIRSLNRARLTWWVITIISGSIPNSTHAIPAKYLSGQKQLRR
jgi:beta-galactosidase